MNSGEGNVTSLELSERDIRLALLRARKTAKEREIRAKMTQEEKNRKSARKKAYYEKNREKILQRYRNNRAVKMKKLNENELQNVTQPLPQVCEYSSDSDIVISEVCKNRQAFLSMGISLMDILEAEKRNT
jgi:hypothetical protein